MAEDNGKELDVGHDGAGDDCIGKVIDKTGKFFLAGTFVRLAGFDGCALFRFCVGGAFGATEGCFLTPIAGNTSPMIFRCLALMMQRSILIGKYAASHTHLSNHSNCCSLGCVLCKFRRLDTSDLWDQLSKRGRV